MKICSIIKCQLGNINSYNDIIQFQIYQTMKEKRKGQKEGRKERNKEMQEQGEKKERIREN